MAEFYKLLAKPGSISVNIISSKLVLRIKDKCLLFLLETSEKCEMGRGKK